jgi:hypothetical protein
VVERYTFGDLLDEVRVVNNLLKLAEVDLVYMVYHSNNKTSIECGTAAQIKRWSGTQHTSVGTPTDCKNSMHETLSTYLLERLIGEERI